ncbi:MAG: LamG domain-containing protein, partial [Planctomycetes bacterium]|nr:LamG domain-containing protein [Planctomycetota bacterium]
MNKKTILFSFFIMFFLLVANSLAVEKATAPIPADGAINVDDDYAIYLEWTPGDSAESHDIYLGTDYDAVNNATTSSAEFLDNRGRPKYAFVDFDYNTMYYWRIDEVTATTTIKGDVWSFTTYNLGPIVWYKFDETSDVNVADSSGYGFDTVVSGAATPEWDTEGAVGGCLQETGQWTAMNVVVPPEVFSTISTKATFAWWGQLTPTSTGGGFFTGSNTSDDLIIKATPYPKKDPNTNEILDWYVAYRAGNETGNETINWWWGYGDVAAVGEWHHFALTYDESAGIKKLYFDGEVVSNPGTDPNDSMANINVFKIFSRTAAEASTWDCFKGKMDDFRIYSRALAEEEVRLFVGDRFKPAANPDPANGAEEVALAGVTLSWRPGQDAVDHQVYFSDDRIEVKNADVNSPCYKGEQAGVTYETGALELMKTYYWRVDEIDGDSVLWKGPIWQFS